MKFSSKAFVTLGSLCLCYVVNATAQENEPQPAVTEKSSETASSDGAVASPTPTAKPKIQQMDGRSLMMKKPGNVGATSNSRMSVGVNGECKDTTTGMTYAPDHPMFKDCVNKSKSKKDGANKDSETKPEASVNFKFGSEEEPKK